MGLSIVEIFSVIESFAVAVAAVVAVLGLNTWRKQLVGSRKVELAEKTLTCAYKCASAFQFARSKYGFEGEGETRPSRGEPPEFARQRNTYFVPVERLKQIPEFAELHALTFSCRALFGNDVVRGMRKFDDLRVKIIFASRRLIRDTREHPHRDENAEQSGEERMRRDESIIWDESSPGKPDEFAAEVENALAEIERGLKPVLTG